MSWILDSIDPLQKVLNFGSCTNPQFRGNGLGKIGTTGFFIGLVGGVHFGVGVTLYLVKSSIAADQTSHVLSALVGNLSTCDFVLVSNPIFDIL